MSTRIPHQPTGNSTRPEELLTIKQAAAYLVVSQPTLRRMIDRKDFTFYRIGRQIRIDKQELVNFLKYGRSWALLIPHPTTAKE